MLLLRQIVVVIGSSTARQRLDLSVERGLVLLECDEILVAAVDDGRDRGFLQCNASNVMVTPLMSSAAISSVIVGISLCLPL